MEDNKRPAPEVQPLPALAPIVILLSIFVVACAASLILGTGKNKDPAAIYAEQRADLLRDIEENPEKYEPKEEWAGKSWSNSVRQERVSEICRRSKEKVRLTWPYEDVFVQLCFRKGQSTRLDARVQLMGDGQIVCGIGSSCRIAARIGDAQMRYFEGLPAADGTSNVLFLSSPGQLLRGANRGEMIRIELEFYQAGLQPIEFSTERLAWEHQNSAGR